MPTADEIFPKCSKVKQFLGKRSSLCCCPFLWGGEFTFKIKHVGFIVPDNLWPVGWLADGFNTSRIANSHPKLNIEQSEPDRKIKTRVFYLSSTARLTCLSLSLFRLSLPFTAEKRKTTTTNFAQTTLQQWPEISAGRRAGGWGGKACWVLELLRKFVNFSFLFFVRLDLYWIIYRQTYI